MKKSVQMANALAEKREAVKKLLSLETPTAEETTQAETLMGEIKSLDAGYKKQLEIESFEDENEAALKALNAPVTPVVHPDGANSLAAATAVAAAPATKAIVLPGIVSSLKNFKGSDAELKAYKFGQWFLSCVVAPSKPDGVQRYAKNIEWVKDHTPYLKAQSEATNIDGGALVPDEFDRNIIDLREKFGVLRRYSKIVPMMTDTKIVPRRTGGLTPYFVGDNAAITESQKSWNDVQLLAKKLAVLTKYSSEVAEDAIINMGDDLAGEIAYAFSLKEDQCGFLGDGTSTYGGMVGYTQAFLNLSGTIANIAGLTVASGSGYATSYGSIVLTDFESVVGNLPEYADTPNARWFCHKTFYHTVMEKLQLAAGGVTSVEIRDGQRVFRFLGYDVVFVQALPKTSAVSQVCAILGDLALASRFGDRRRTTIAIDTSIGFANDQWAIKGTERFDHVVHDIGNASATASARVAGPVVGLITAAS